MKNLIIIVLLSLSSVVHSQTRFLLYGQSLNATEENIYAVLYKADTIANTWSYSNTMLVPKNYEIILPTKELYVIDFINGESIKTLYVNTSVPGEFELNVDYSSANVGTLFYSEKDFKYVIVAGTDEELFP